MKIRKIVINNVVEEQLEYNTIRVDFLTKQISIQIEVGALTSDLSDKLISATILQVFWNETTSVTLNNITQVDMVINDNNTLEVPMHSVVLHGENII